MLQRQGSFRGFNQLNQASPFKRQMSLRISDLPSNLERTRAMSLQAEAPSLIHLKTPGTLGGRVIRWAEYTVCVWKGMAVFQSLKLQIFYRPPFWLELTLFPALYSTNNNLSCGMPYDLCFRWIFSSDSLRTVLGCLPVTNYLTSRSGTFQKHSIVGELTHTLRAKVQGTPSASLWQAWVSCTNNCSQLQVYLIICKSGP